MIWKCVAALIGVSALTLGVNIVGDARAGASLAGATTPTTPVKVGPSGLPVPRFVALRKGYVRARFGPSTDYPVAYEFRRQGLPLKVIEEDRDNSWRRIEDRDGQRAWIHRSMLAFNENVVIEGDGAILRSEPDGNAKGRARLAAGVMARINECTAQWCRVEAEGYRGWVERSALWGAPLSPPV